LFQHALSQCLAQEILKILKVNNLKGNALV